MPEPEPSSPWAREAHPAAYERTGRPAPAAQPAHAWVSTDPYPAPYPAMAAPTPVATSAGAGVAAPYPVPPIEVRVAAPPAPGRALAVVGVVLGGLALVGVVVALVVSLVALGTGDDGSGGGGYGSPRGSIAPAAGGGLSGAALAEEVTDTMTGLGEEPEDVVCPATAKVAQDVTTVCHGTDYGDEATFVVFFEDAKGSYTVLEL